MIKQAIIVEGRYDKNTLSQIVDAPIFETNGFGIFKDKKRLAMLRKIAYERGVIIFTDSDGAGFVIRNFLKGALPKDKVLHAYIPDVYGKERRKAEASKEGKLGVEGMSRQVILKALEQAGAEEMIPPSDPITKSDLFLMGYSGPGSSEKRKALMKELGMPEHIGSNAFLDALNLLMGREEFMRQYGEKHG
jgi:ribonuclease M5